MVGIKNLALLAAAGSALAAPQQWPGNGWGHGHVVTVNDVVYTTVVVTVTAGQEPTSTSAPPPPPTTTTSPSPVAAETTEAPATPQATQAAQPSSAAPQSSSAPSTGSTGGYMDIVNEWRSKMGMSALTMDSTLQANAQKTCDDSNGQLNHELNPGSMAQVLAPGSLDNFEKIFVGGWLCELPSLPGLDGICSTMSQGWSYDGQTGHAAILTSPSYSKIGCAAAENVCGCDLA